MSSLHDEEEPLIDGDGGVDDPIIGENVVDERPPSYSQVIQGLTRISNKKTVHRDPRSKRLAAVTAAIVEIASTTTCTTDDDIDGPENNNLSPAKVYSHTMTALEGTLLSSSKTTFGEEEESTANASAAILDSLATQVALLELLATTVPYIQPARILVATLPLTFRVLKALVVTCQAVDTAALMSIETNMDNELGSVNAVLRGTSRASSAILQQLVVTNVPLPQPPKLVQDFYTDTLLVLLHDKRPKVRKAAQHGALKVLTAAAAASSSNACLALVRKSTMTVLHTILQHTLQQQQQQAEKTDNDSATTTANCMHHLAFLEKCAVHLTPSQQQRLSTDVMELLTAMFQHAAASSTTSTGRTATSSMDFVALSSRKKKNIAQQQEEQSTTLLMVALLSVVLVWMQREENDTTTSSVSQELAPRVLASLLTATGANPTWLFRVGVADADVLQRGRILYGQVLLGALNQLLQSSDSTKMDLTLRLLPPTLQMLLLLCKPSSSQALNDGGDDDDNATTDSVVAQTLFAEWTQIMRTSLATFLQQAAAAGSISASIAKCLQDSTKALQQVMQPAYNYTWSVSSLQSLVVWVQAILLPLHKSGHEADQVCSASSALIVESLLQLRNDEGAGTQHIAAVDDALSSLVQGVGLEAVWCKWIQSWLVVVPQQHQQSQQKEILHPNRVWILGLLQKAALTAQPHPPTLSFFQERILTLARSCDRMAYGGTASSTAASKKQKKMQNFYHARVVDLWAFLPCVCKGPPTDLETCLPSLTTTMCKALDDSSRYPQLVSIICQGLTTLAKSLEDQQRSDNVDENLQAVVHQSVVKLLPVMFNIVTTLSNNSGAAALSKQGRGGDKMDVDKQATTTSTPTETVTDQGQHTQIISEAISALCRHAPKPFLQGLFKKLMHRLLEQVQSDDETNGEKICSLLSLSQALVSSGMLEDESLSFLYRALKPFIRNDDYGARAQKRAYKVLAELCERHNSFFVNDMERLQELTSLLTGSIATCQVAPRHMRLKCLGIVVEGWDVDSSAEHFNQVSKAMLAEVLLYLKDSNAKTRQMAYELVLSLAKKGDISDFLRVVTAALGAETPHMRSAGMMALSRIIYEFAWQDENLQALLPSLLNTVLVLINDNSREVIKSVVGFIRISVAAIPAEQLEPLLPDLIGSLLKYHKIKDRFRSKIKIILKKLVKLFGYPALMPFVPESETRLLTHMRKLDERQKRKKAALKAEMGERRGAAAFDDILESDEEDSDDGRTLMTGATGFTKLTSRSMKSAATKSVGGKTQASTKASRKSMATSATTSSKRGVPAVQLPDETDGEVVDMLGAKMAKRVHFANDTHGDYSDDDDDDSGGAMEFDDDGKLIIPDDDDVSSRRRSGKDEETTEERFGKRRKLSKFEEAKATQKNKESGKKGPRQLGSAYKSKKAGGDVKRKEQKYEPYAYVPLDGRNYSKKFRSSAVEQMSTVVRQGAKGKRKRR